MWSALFLACLILFVLSLAVTGFLHLVVLRVPFVPSSSKLTEAMIDQAQLKGNEIVYDLGAGDGKVLIAAKRRHSGITAIGCEIVPTVWLLGKIRIFLSGVGVDLRLKNALHQDLYDADVILLYVTPILMQKLLPKFERELRSGTRVISNTFQLPGRKAERVVMVGAKKIYVYGW